MISTTGTRAGTAALWTLTALAALMFLRTASELGWILSGAGHVTVVEPLAPIGRLMSP